MGRNLSKYLKDTYQFFINPKTGRRTYSELCRKCCNDCKQSYRAKIIQCKPCKLKVSKRTKSK